MKIKPVYKGDSQITVSFNI
ncbi:hypothetical protein [Parageobacillus toebii]